MRELTISVNNITKHLNDQIEESPCAPSTSKAKPQTQIPTAPPLVSIEDANDDDMELRGRNDRTDNPNNNTGGGPNNYTNPVTTNR